MLAEFLREVVGLAGKAKSVEFHTNPSLPRTVFVRHGDELKELPVPAAQRSHKLADFDSLVEAITDDKIASDPEVYVAQDSIVALLDRSDRRARVSVALATSHRFNVCEKLETPARLTPKDAVRLLKLELHGGTHDPVTQALSRIDFKRAVGAASDLAHGRETLGRSVEASVQQAKDIPEQFTVAIPIWTTQGFQQYVQHVTFGLYLDLEGQVVELRVLSDECEAARNRALQQVAADLRKSLAGAAPVFLGVP